MPTLNEREVDDEIAKDWEAISVRRVEAEMGEDPTPEPVEQAAEEPGIEKAAEPAAADGKPTDTRARDKETGKFVEAKAPAKAARGADGAGKPAAAAVEQPTGEQPGQEQQQTQQAAGHVDTSRPPSTWKPTARAEWDKLPPVLREEIHRRESDFMRGQQQLMPDARLGNAMRQVMEPYRQMIEAEGGNPAAAVSDLLRTANILRNGSQEVKLAAVGRIAQQFGIDLRQLVQPTGQQPGQSPEQLNGQPANPAQFRDPRVDAILQQQERERQQREQQDYNARTQTASQWMNEVDAQGKPLRPYVNDVMTEMSALVPQIRQAKPGLSHAQVLQEAYDSAIWAHPEIRELLLRQQQQEQQQIRNTENQQRVAEARRSTAGNVPRRASIPSPAKPGSMDDTIKEAARELGLLN